MWVGPPLWGEGAKGCGYEHVSLQTIEKVRETDQAMLAERELYWQNQLRCYVKNEGQGHCYRKELPMIRESYKY